MNIDKLKENTIKKLEELKSNLSFDYEKNYSEMLNILSDYDYEAQDSLYLYDNINDLVEFVDDETLKYYVDYQLNTFGYERLFYMFNGVNNVCGLYVIDGYGNLRDVEISDFECCIDETINTLKESLEV